MIRHVHIEGMDLAGKTTCSKGLVKSFGGAWEMKSNSLSGGDNPIHKLADELRISDQYNAAIVGHLYVVALMADLNKYEPPKVNTIQDSTVLLRSLAYHTVSGNAEIVDMLKKLLPKHPDFDHTFILTANIEARLKRLESRKAEHPEEVAPDDLMIIRKPEKFFAMEKCLVEIVQSRFRSTLLDTTFMTPEMVVNNVREILDKRGERT